MASHGSAAKHLLGADSGIVDLVTSDWQSAPVTPRLHALLAIADKVRADPTTVAPADIEAARAEGADDKAIHDTVLVAAAFSMFTRYVDGLGTWTPRELSAFDAAGQRLAEQGYVRPAPSS